jgi:hypothetical protein
MMPALPFVSRTGLMNPPAVSTFGAVQARATPSGVVFVFVLLLAAALAPVLWFNIPAAMVDYPNHLARMFLLSRDAGHPHPYYEVHWSFVPNLAMDLLVPSAGRLIGVETADRLFYLLSQILIVTGALAVERAVKGRMHIAGFVALMFLYSLPFAWGFENFEFGLGCALWGFACVVLLQDRAWPVRLAAHTVIVALLFMAHLFALGIYGFAVGIHELWRAWSRRAALLETLGRLAMLGIPSLVIFATMIGNGGGVGGKGTFWVFSQKYIWPLHIFSGYSLPVSGAGFVALFWLTAFLARRSGLRFEQSGAWLLAGFCALYLAMPFELFDTAFVDIRVVIAAALILPAFISVSFPNQNWARVGLAVAVAVTIVNVGVVISVWLSYRADYAAAYKSFELLPKGAIVLVGDSGNGDDPPANLRDYPIYNVPTLAVHYADAFVPSLFTDPGKQPVEPRAPWRRLDVPYGNLVPAKLLKHIAERGAPPGTPVFIHTWQRDFDYLYLLGRSIQNPMPERLDLVLAAPRFALFRIKKPSSSPNAMQ